MNYLVLILWLISGIISNCKSRSSENAGRLKIDNGFFVFESGTYMPGVVPLSKRITPEIAGCTSTAVSDSTLLTAAHCVVDENEQPKETSPISRGSKRCIALPDQKGLCSDEIYFPTAFLEMEDSPQKRYDHDIAVIIFPKDTFKYYHVLDQSKSLDVSASFLMVGFSRHELFSDEFPKRWGRNIVKDDGNIKDFSPDVIVSEKASSDKLASAVSPGDSGGPLLDLNCNLHGVASRMVSNTDARANDFKYSLHTSVHSQFNRDFLNQVSSLHGAKYCKSGESCGSSERVVAISAKDPKFPCKAPGEDTDSILIAAIKDIESKRAQKLGGRSGVALCDGPDMGRLGLSGGTCLKLEMVDATSKGKECDAMFVYQDGGKHLDKKSARAFFNELPVAAPSGVSDKAYQSLNESIAKSSKWPSSLACETISGELQNKCCFKRSCFSVAPTRERPVKGESVECPTISEETFSGLSKTALLPNGEASIPGAKETLLVPDLKDLETKSFLCTRISSLVLRTTTGICIKQDDLPSGIGVDSFDQRDSETKNNLKCLNVKAQKVTGQEIQCPKA
jgi:Trypsin